MCMTENIINDAYRLNPRVSQVTPMLRVAGIVPESIVDGPGIRYTIFTQGCFHNCRGCHNPQTHTPNGGEEKSINDIYEEIRKYPHCKNITISGGEPFMQPIALSYLVVKLKQMGYNILVYTGFTIEELTPQVFRNPSMRAILNHIDILIDGKYREDLQDLSLPFRGSSNQRIIDVPKTLEAKEVIEYIL